MFVTECLIRQPALKLQSPLPERFLADQDLVRTQVQHAILDVELWTVSARP
jgi:hypothetical protein